MWNGYRTVLLVPLNNSQERSRGEGEGEGEGEADQAVGDGAGEREQATLLSKASSSSSSSKRDSLERRSKRKREHEPLLDDDSTYVCLSVWVCVLPTYLPYVVCVQVTMKWKLLQLLGPSTTRLCLLLASPSTSSGTRSSAASQPVLSTSTSTRCASRVTGPQSTG